MSKELKTGIVVIIIIVGFIFGFNFLKGKNLFDGNARYFEVHYNKIGGLTKSSPVTINGLKVGKVDDIQFNKTQEERGRLIVRFSIDIDFDFSKNSIVRIYSPSPLGGSNLAVVPNYKGELAVSGDILNGEMEESLFTSIGERLNPLQHKLEDVIESADSLFKKINNVLDTKTQTSLKKSVKTLEYTLFDVRKTIKSLNSILDSSSTNLNVTLKNTKAITENLAKVSNTLANANFAGIIAKAETSLNSVSSLFDGINNAKGTLGKLVTDDTMYNNLKNASKELEELLKEVKLNPKRFMHFSVFGKKAKPYNPEKSKNNETNQ